MKEYILEKLSLLPSWVHQIVYKITGYVIVKDVDDKTMEVISWYWCKYENLKFKQARQAASRELLDK